MLFGWEQVCVVVAALIVIRTRWIKLHFLIFILRAFTTSPWLPSDGYPRFAPKARNRGCALHCRATRLPCHSEAYNSTSITTNKADKIDRGCKPRSIFNPEQVLPLSKLALKAHTLRDPEARDDAPFDLLAGLASRFTATPVFPARLIEVGNKPVALDGCRLK